MFGINKVYIVGHLGAAPVKGTSKNGKPYAKLSVATNRSRKLDESTFETMTDWHQVTVWGKQGETCLQNLDKGSKVMVEGYLSQFEVTDKNGETRKQSAITAHNIEFFNSKSVAKAA